MSDDTSAGLDAIRERWEAATPGRWWTKEMHDPVPGYVDIVADRPLDDDGVNAVAFFVSEAGDAEAIAHAPDDIAALLAEVERLQRESFDMSARITWQERKIESLRAGLDCDPVTGSDDE